MASGVAAPPDPDPRGVDLGQGAGVGDGVAVVADLGPRVDLLPRLAVAGTEVAVVEHQHVEPGPVEYLSKTVEVHLLHRGEAVGHDNSRRRAGLSRIEPAAQDDTLGVELDVASSHLDLLVDMSPEVRPGSVDLRIVDPERRALVRRLAGS